MWDGISNKNAHFTAEKWWTKRYFTEGSLWNCYMKTVQEKCSLEDGDFALRLLQPWTEIGFD